MYSITVIVTTNFFGYSVQYVFQPVLRIHGQPKFINHDALAEGLLNQSHCTAVGFLLPWKHQLTNSNSLLDLVISRMELDWLALAPRTRKAWNLKDLESRFVIQKQVFVPCCSTKHFLEPLPRNPTPFFYQRPPEFCTKTQLQRTCGGFLACLDTFATLVPKKFSDTCLSDIHKASLDKKWNC